MSPPPRRRSPLALLGAAAAAWLLLAGCFQQNAQPSTGPEIVRAEATSNTSFLLRFREPVGDGAGASENYLVRDPDGVHLPVVAAYVLDGGAAVLLATEPQGDVSYRITVRNVGPSAGEGAGAEVEAPERVPGSATAAPMVASAVALSNTEVLVAFGDPASGGFAGMNDDALRSAAYTFDPALEVHEAAFSDDGDDRGRVVLKTASMAGASYTLRVGHATAGDPPVLLDPFRSERTFLGIAATDVTPPALTGAYATDATTVVVSFSEPVRDDAADPSHYAISDDAGEPLAVSSADLAPYATRVTLTTRALEASSTYTLTASGVHDLSDNVIADGETTEFAGVASGSDGAAPRVTGATSTGPHRVLVAFSEPVRGGEDSASNPDHYSIVGTSTLEASLEAQAILDVTAAELADNGRSVVLTTLAQSDISYTLRVSNVVDLDGNMVVGPTRSHPFDTEFFGTAESGAGVDSDGDGLTDAAEQRGWMVSVVDADGNVREREVTSDPFSPDTDGDDLSDLREKANGTDPRSADTDGDELDDVRELDRTYSDPTEADSDGDGLEDGLEVTTFSTSPLYADTDGDQFDDGYEVTTDNRNPRIADLPIVEIDVGNVDLQLDVRFEEQSSEGTTTVDSKNVSTTLERSEASRTERVQADTDEWFVNATASICILGGCSVDTFAAGGEVEVSGGFTRTSTTTNTSESTRASQEAYERSLTTEAAVSAETSLTRVVEGANMAVAVSISNPGNVSYTIRDIEITALTQSGRDASTLVPVATLFAASDSPISVGPLNPTRGPFRFVADTAYPRLVEQLMQNPRGITFKIANYMLEDEFGRRFAFVQQDVNDRTAALKINYAGNRELELYQVATNAGFAPDGRPEGVSMASVLEGTLGLQHVPPEVDRQLDPTSQADADLIDASYSTRVVDGVEVLYRVREVSRDLTGEDRDWYVYVYDGADSRMITPVDDNPGRDFRSVTVLAEADFAFYFVQDLDDDALQKTIEATYGSVDSEADALRNACFGLPATTACDLDAPDGVPDSLDSDRDGLADNTELEGPYVGNDYRPWMIRFEDGRDAYRTSANPARADTDRDGLSDCQELVPTDDGTPTGTPLPCSEIVVYEDADGLATLDDGGGINPVIARLTLPNRTDPAAQDTDGDGLTDSEEVVGFSYQGLDGHQLVLRPTDTAPATSPVDRDSDDDNLDDRSEIRLRSNPMVPDGDSVFDDDGDGLVNIEETTLRVIDIDDYVYANDDPADRQASVSSDVDLVDTDGDGLTDWEEYQGCRDANRDLTCDPDGRSFRPTSPGNDDTDEDGLTDLEEVDGVEFIEDGNASIRYTDPVDGDSDDDGRIDGDEILVPWTVFVTDRGGERVYSDPLRADADGDGLTDAEEFALGTHPGEADTDGDGALDELELGRATDPLTPDHYVTVTYLAFQAGKGGGDANADCDDGQNPGDFRFVFRTGVSTDTGFSRRVVTSHGASSVDVESCDVATSGPCLRTEPDGYTYLEIASPQTVYMRPSASTSFAVPLTEIFTLEGWVQEVDPEAGTWFADLSYYFGGIGAPDGVYDGSTLSKGSFGVAFNSPPRATDNRSCPVEITAQVRVE